MVTKRNDTLSAQIIGSGYLPCSQNKSPNLCFPFQVQQVAIQPLMILIMSVIVAVSTYQLCCKKSTKNAKNKTRNDIKCFSLTFLYCIWIQFILFLIIPLFLLEPMGDFGWEWSDTNGWIYDSNTPGWQWENKKPMGDTYRKGDWVYNYEGSWQWNDNGDGGWYFDTSYEPDMAVGIIMYILISFMWTIGSCSNLFAYLYPFKRLFHAFNGTQYALQKNSINLHYGNCGLIFFLTAIGSICHMLGDQHTSFRLWMASSAFLCLGLLAIMYQFNKRLLQFISMQQINKTEFSSTNKSVNQPVESASNSDCKAEDKIELSSYQIQLLYIVIKNSTLTGVLLIISTLMFIENILLQFFEKSTTNDMSSESWGRSQMYHFPTVVIGHLSMAVVIILGFSENKILYDKLCFYCHRKFSTYCNNMAQGQIQTDSTATASQVQLKDVPATTDLSTTEKQGSQVTITIEASTISKETVSQQVTTSTINENSK